MNCVRFFNGTNLLFSHSKKSRPAVPPTTPRSSPGRPARLPTAPRSHPGKPSRREGHGLGPPLVISLGQVGVGAGAGAGDILGEGPGACRLGAGGSRPEVGIAVLEFHSADSAEIGTVLDGGAVGVERVALAARGPRPRAGRSLRRVAGEVFIEGGGELCRGQFTDETGRHGLVWIGPKRACPWLACVSREKGTDLFSG